MGIVVVFYGENFVGGACVTWDIDELYDDDLQEAKVFILCANFEKLIYFPNL